MLPLVGGSLRRLQPCVGTTQGYESFQDLGRGCGKRHRVEFGTPWDILSRNRVGTLAFSIVRELEEGYGGLIKLLLAAFSIVLRASLMHTSTCAGKLRRPPI